MQNVSWLRPVWLRVRTWLLTYIINILVYELSLAKIKWQARRRNRAFLFGWSGRDAAVPATREVRRDGLSQAFRSCRKTAIVLGAASGIGKSSAEALASLGARAICADRSLFSSADKTGTLP